MKYATGIMEKLADSLIDANIFSPIFKGNLPVKKFIENLSPAVDSTVYIENLQGSKSNSEKARIKKYLTKFAIFYQTEETSRRANALIEQFSNTHGLMLADAQIAAVCLEQKLTLVTYNVKDFLFVANLKVTTPPFPTV